MKNQGFTLIEVIVAMTIVSIMAGILVPLSYRIWETQEIEVTRNRMASLKMAMVGDASLYQHGIRSDYGFVGDNGELPAALSDLVVDNGSFDNWLGPYLNAGFDPATYDRDAWGEGLLYSPALDAAGRRVSAALISRGPDRTLNTADDLDVAAAPAEQIYAAEVTPTSDIQGNLAYAISVSDADVSPVYSASMIVQYQGLAGLTTVQANDCAQVDVGLVQKLVPRSSIFHYSSFFPVKLPVGKVVVKGRLFANAVCSGAPLVETDGMAFFISGGLKVIYVNPSMLYYHIVNGP